MQTSGMVVVSSRSRNYQKCSFKSLNWQDFTLKDLKKNAEKTDVTVCSKCLI